MRPTTACTTLFLWLFAAASLAPAGHVIAADYYLSPTGNDANSGASAAPWRTLQKAANTVSPGDIVHVADGTYAGMHMTRDGTAALPITFRGEGANVLVNARNATTNDNINLEGASYVIIDGFAVEDAPRIGIRVVESQGVIVRNNVVARSGTSGILSGFATNLQIIDNICYGAIAEHGIYVSNSRVDPDNVVVRGNECYGNNQNGIQFNGDCFEGGDGIISTSVIEGNSVHDNNWKGLSLISMQYSVVRNNIIYENGVTSGAGGIHLVDQPDCAKPSNNNLVVNNTVIEPRIAAIRINLGSVNNVIFNNALVASTVDRCVIDEVGGNAIDAVSNIRRASISGLFVDVAARNFRPASGSPLVNSGASDYQGGQAPTTDFAGAARPFGAAWDVGAFELGGGGGGDVVLPTVAITSPTDGATVSIPVTVRADATDNVAVAGVTFAVNGVTHGGEDTQAPYQASLSGIPNGAHVLTASARDAAGNRATSAGIDIIANSGPPSTGILADHPRLVLNPTRLAQLRAAACYDDNGNPIPNCTPTYQWVKVRDYARQCYADPGSCYAVQPWVFALYYMITGDVNYANRTISLVDSHIANGLDAERSDRFLSAHVYIEDAAFAFDWLPHLLTPQKKATYIDYMNRIVQEIFVEDPYNNPFYENSRWAVDNPGNNYYYGHMLCAVMTAIATYNENDFTLPLNGNDVPLALYFNKENRLYTDILQFVYDKFEREAHAAWTETKAIGGGWHEGTDYGNAAVNRMFESYLYLRDAGGRDYFTTTNFPRHHARYFLYSIQPGNAVRYNGGDSGRDKSASVNPYTRRVAVQLARGLAGTTESQYIQYWANHEYATLPGGWSEQYGPNFIWTDLTLPERNYAELPTHYFSPGTGWMNSRTGWDDAATSVSFICTDREMDHQHKDQNSFVIYKGSDLEGWLAIDANFCSESNGLTQAGAVHNTILVNREDQRFAEDIGEVLRNELTAEYRYVMGDAADAYWTNNGAFDTGDEPYLSTYLRELVHVLPNYVVVYDRVTPLTKFQNVPIAYLLNMRNTPTISGNTVTTVSGPNKLVQKTLLPSSAFSIVTANSAGCTRIELMRTTPAPNTQFLNVLHVGGTADAVPPIDLVITSTNNMVGAHIKENGRNVVAMFSSEPTGTVPPSRVQFQLSTLQGTTNYLFGLLPAADYGVDVVCEDGTQIITVCRGEGYRTTDQGVLRFDAPYAPEAPKTLVLVR